MNNLNENLHISPALFDALIDIEREHDDKVSQLLKRLYWSPAYKDDEDINFIDLCQEIKMLSFLPKSRRTETSMQQFTEMQELKGATKIKIGRLVKAIYEKVKPILNAEFEIGTYIVEYNSMRNRVDILLERDPEILILEGPKDSVIKIKVDDRVIVEGNLVDGYSLEWNDNNDFKIEDESAAVPKYRIRLNGSPYFCKQFDALYDHSIWDVSQRYFQTGDKKVMIKRTLVIENSFDLSDKDIELFSSRLINFINVNRSDKDCVFKEVNGEDIRYWYNAQNYQSDAGELGSSCMASEECENYFDIYCDNKKQVSLIILLNSNNKLIGRALKWHLKNGRYFLDRVYTSVTSDKALFYDLAKKNDWIYKVTEMKERYFRDGDLRSEFIPLEVELDYYGHYQDYPYLDTLCYLCHDTLTNAVPKSNYYFLRSTAGSWEWVEVDDDDDDDDDF